MSSKPLGHQVVVTFIQFSKTFISILTPQLLNFVRVTIHTRSLLKIAILMHPLNQSSKSIYYKVFTTNAEENKISK